MPANLFFEHVGGKGVQLHFPQSIRRKLTLDVLSADMSAMPPDQARAFSDRISAAFPDGFNCWGFPSPADRLFNRLQPGDVVVLVGLVQKSVGDGEVRCVCRVVEKSPRAFHSSSAVIWGEARYPLMFFFNAVEIDMPWSVFRSHINFRSDNPWGRVYMLNPRNLHALPGGSADAYFWHLVDVYGQSPVSSEALRYITDLDDRGTAVREEGPRHRYSVAVAERHRAFAARVKELFGYQCVVCGFPQIGSPAGQPTALEAAHIVPIHEPYNGQDVEPNGLCLCVFHHWAFDAGLLHLQLDGAGFLCRVNRAALSPYSQHEVVRSLLLQYDGKRAAVGLPRATRHARYLQELRNALDIRCRLVPNLAWFRAK
jgi:hypothetical protein